MLQSNVVLLCSGGRVKTLLLVLVVSQPGSNFHYCLVSLMWMKIGSNDITAQVPGVS
jgi:hypothetical protein